MKYLLEKLGITDFESFKNFVIQFIKFGLVGITNTIVHLGVYYLLLYFDIHYIIANTLGFLISIMNSYFWNSRFVFKSNKEGATTFLRTFLAYGSTFLLSSVLLFIMVDIIGISDKIAPLLNMFITIPLNFLLNKFWAYKQD